VKRTARQKRKKLLIVLFVLPSVITICSIYIYPLLYSAWMSLHIAPLITDLDSLTFVGFDNFINILTKLEFWQSFRVTILFTVITLIAELSIGFFIARIVVDIRTIWIRNFVRTIIVLPLLLNPIVIALLWRSLFDPQFGFVNFLLQKIQIPPVAWFSTPIGALFTVIIADIWHTTPFCILASSAGLLSQDQELFEASEVDGASEFQKTIFIRLPLLRPVLLVQAVFRFIQIFALIDKIYVLTGGGPGRSTTVITLDIFEKAFYGLKIGPASAESWIMLAISLLVGVWLIKSLSIETY